MAGADLLIEIKNCLLRCVRSLLAQSGVSLQCQCLTAIGGEADMGARRGHVDRERLTPSGHAAPSFVAMHATDPLQTCYSQSVILALG
jgi:hypothetical protein